MYRTLLMSCMVFATGIAFAQEPQHVAPYDSLQAGLDSYAYGEALRQEKIARQLNANDQMRWWRGQPAAGDAYRYPPSLDYIYVTGRRGLFGRYRERVYFGSRDIFTPWPVVPGDIWGTADTSTAREF